MTRPTTRVEDRPLTRKECGEAGILARLSTEDWNAMAAPALASPNHVSKMDRWLKIAAERNPNLSPDQLDRLADRLRTEHYRKMGRLSAQAKKLARQASTILAEIDQADAGSVSGSDERHGLSQTTDQTTDTSERNSAQINPCAAQTDPCEPASGEAA